MTKITLFDNYSQVYTIIGNHFVPANQAYLKMAAPKTAISPDGAVAMSSVNGLVGPGFASRYRFLPRAGF